MGVFYLDCDVINPRKLQKKAHVPKLLVDSGSEHTWISSEFLKKAGITVAKKDVLFQMANGQTISRSVGYAILRTAEFETVDEVVIGQPGDLCLLGARTLEGFGAIVDPRKKKLVAAGPKPAALAARSPASPS
jgi:predicted aspartyl protease